MKTNNVLYFHDSVLTIIDKYRKAPCNLNSGESKILIFNGDNAEILINNETTKLERGNCIFISSNSDFTIPANLCSSFTGVSFTLEKNDFGSKKLYNSICNVLSGICVIRTNVKSNILQNNSELENNMELMKLILLVAKEKNYHQEGKISQLVLNFITLNYSIHISSELLEKTFNMSYVKLLTAFKKEYGISIHRKLKEIRINAAKKLLIETDIPISEISFRVGYENEYYFSASFKNITLQSPSKFRESYKKGVNIINEF